MTSFLLRFQEYLRTPSPNSNCTGTQTHTFVQNEQADFDPQQNSFRMLPLDTEAIHPKMPAQSSPNTLLSGTKTVTEIRQESADNDPASRSFKILPKENVR